MAAARYVAGAASEAKGDNMPQSDANEATESGFPIGRRDLVVKGGALAVAGAAMSGITVPAFAAFNDDAGICAIKAPFAIHGGSIVHGFMAEPMRGAALDVVVVIGEDGRSDATAQATARRYAHAGYFAMAPDLPATFGKADPATLRDKIQALTPMLARLPRSTGNVRFVTA
jgi:hypothetical protein